MELQAAKVLRTGALCVALAGVGTGVMGTLGELGADLAAGADHCLCR